MRRIVIELIVLLVVTGALGIAYFWQDVLPLAPKIKSIAPTHSSEGGVSAATPSLNSINDGDKSLLQSMDQLIGHDRLEELFNLNDLIRRFVVTVDAATDSKIPSQFSLFKPLRDTFRIEKDSESILISPMNFQRYSSYVDLLTSINSKKLVMIYARNYALFQQAHEDLGTKDYFNDHLIAAIDNAVSAPNINTASLLHYASYYRFTDSELEKLSAVQKLLIRMGPQNAALVKRKLMQIRKLLIYLKK